MSRLNTMEALTKQLPLNKLGLPRGIFRLDLLNLDDLEQELEPSNTHDGFSSSSSHSGSLTPSVSLPELIDEPVDPESSDQHSPPSVVSDLRDQLKVAYEPLVYAEGFPTLSDGRPFWGRLDFEPTEAFEAFRAYLAQGQKGARQLFILEDEVKTPLSELQGYLHFYYWIFRARAFDLFRSAEAKKLRHERALTLDSEHFVIGEQLLDICKEYMEGKEFIDLLTPKTAMEGAKLAIQLQRMGAGLPINGPVQNGKGENNNGANGGGSTNFQVIMNTVARQELSGPVIEGTTNPLSDPTDDGSSEIIMKEVLLDPETAEMAQELVVRMQRG